MPYNLFQKSKSSRKEVFFPVDQRTIFRMGANFPAFSCLAFRFMIEYFYRMRERSLCMKKLVGVVTCVVLLTSMISVASADIFFDYTTSAISGFPTWSNLALQSNGKIGTSPGMMEQTLLRTAVQSFASSQMKVITQAPCGFTQQDPQTIMHIMIQPRMVKQTQHQLDVWMTEIQALCGLPVLSMTKLRVPHPVYTGCGTLVIRYLEVMS